MVENLLMLCNARYNSAFGYNTDFKCLTEVVVVKRRGGGERGGVGIVT